MTTDDGTMTIPQLPALAQYLELAGWALVDDDRRTIMWRQQGLTPGKNFQIVLPTNQDVDDWPERALEALQTLAYVERRSPDEIAEDISYGGADNVAVRLTPDAPPGQAPLPLASSAVSALYSYVAGSATALEIPDAVLPSHRPPWAESYANKVRLAAHPGSFVLSLALPLAAEVEAGEASGGDAGNHALFEIPAQPPGRRVTNRMLNAVQVAQRLAAEVLAGRSTISAFGDSSQARAATNATELAALKALGGSGSFPYEIRFAQSPLAGNQHAPVNLQITPGQQRVPAEAAEFLRTRQPGIGVRVYGLVVRLHRTRALGPGDIVIEGFDEESSAIRKWRIELGEGEYNQAARAHLSGLQVAVTGDREEHGPHLQLRNLSSFNIIPGMDFEEGDTATGKP